MFYLPQLTTNDCGVACLKMLLADLNKDRQYLFMPCDENHGSYSFKDLSILASRNGLNLEGFKVIDNEEILRFDLPVIVRMKLESGGHHAVILTKIHRRTVTFMDPHFGKRRMRIESFLEQFEGDGLLINNFEPTPYQYDTIEPLETKHKVFTFLLQILSGLLFATGVYFIQPNVPYFFAVIFIGLGLVTELLLRAYIFKLMKIVDEYFLDRYCDVLNKNYYEYYLRCQEFKKTYLSTRLSVVYALLVSIFIMVISIINTPANFPIVVAPIILSVIQCLVINKKETFEMQKMADEEEHLRRNKNSERMRINVAALQDKAYTFAKFNLIRKFFGVLLFAMTAILASALSDSFTLINIVFLLTVQLFIYQNLTPVFSYERNMEEVYKSKSKVNNMFYYKLHLKDENN